ncbi:CTP synthase [Tolypocladium paradoxum]|uniref:CTP synthase n=1 Tax=Tolypocladium paradoxum TaxID=94208 RepID=A0A2S4L3Y9_9HYPO|nr:CTP synthase [Tolypocladium paradoxum]
MLRIMRISRLRRVSRPEFTITRFNLVAFLTSCLFPRAKMKYVLVSGGVASGVGKGNHRYATRRVTERVDGEESFIVGVVAPDDGAESRGTWVCISRGTTTSITTGKIYKHVIGKERRGDYLGRTVQGHDEQDCPELPSPDSAWEWQIAVIEHARHICGKKGAASEEFDAQAGHPRHHHCHARGTQGAHGRHDAAGLAGDALPARQQVQRTILENA